MAFLVLVVAFVIVLVIGGQQLTQITGNLKNHQFNHFSYYLQYVK